MEKIASLNLKRNSVNYNSPVWTEKSSLFSCAHFSCFKSTHPVLIDCSVPLPLPNRGWESQPPLDPRARYLGRCNKSTNKKSCDNDTSYLHWNPEEREEYHQKQSHSNGHQCPCLFSWLVQPKKARSSYICW